MNLLIVSFRVSQWAVVGTAMYLSLVAACATTPERAPVRGAIVDRNDVVLALTLREGRSGTMRHYPEGQGFAHAVGYVGRNVDAPGNWVGRSAVERGHDKALARGEQVRLTLDAATQRRAFAALSGVRAGAAVVLDPATGEVLALATVPSFDPDAMSGRLTPERWAGIRDNPWGPLQHRAVQPYRLGHALTPFVSHTNASRPSMTADHRVECEGHLNAGGRRFHCNHRQGHGSVGLAEALSRGCSVFFFKFAHGLPHDEFVGPLATLGFGRPTGLSIGEHLGVLPTVQWYREHTTYGWQDSMKLLSSIGHGELTATPVQVALAMARMLNTTPDLSLTLMRHTESEPTALLPRREGPIFRALEVFPSERLAGINASVDAIRRVSRGSREFRRWAMRDHSWFVGYTRRSPARVVVVLVEHGGPAAVAAQVAEQIL